MARRQTKRFTPEHKLKIVKEGSLPNVRVADLCRHYDIYPTDYYRWKKLADINDRRIKTQTEETKAFK